jgi:hypothetical protein
VRELIDEFEAGTLNIVENVSLRRFLSKALNCSPKRISKKFEGVVSYNGKQLYKRKTSALTPQQVQARRDRLRQLEQKYRESLEVLQLVEASRKPTAPAPGNGTPTSPAAIEHASTIARPTSAATESSAAAALAMAQKARIAKLNADIALASLAFDSSRPRSMFDPSGTTAVTVNWTERWSPCNSCGYKYRTRGSSDGPLAARTKGSFTCHDCSRPYSPSTAGMATRGAATASGKRRL